MTKIERGLGKGLSALIGAKISATQPDSQSNDNIIHINIENILPNSEQPRKNFPQEKLDELIASIKQKGILQPILVKPLGRDKYQIIAGERRWRASKFLGIKELPAMVKDLSDKEVMEIAIIENIQRDNLTSIEEAKAYQKLIKEFDYTQEEVAKEVGVSRSHITNLLRVLTLPESILKMIEQDQISLGHAKLLIGHADPYPIARICWENGWSVRILEQALKPSAQDTHLRLENETKLNFISRSKKTGQAKHRIAASNITERDPELASLEESVGKRLKRKVEIINEDNGGKIIIAYKNLEDLDILLNKLYSINNSNFDKRVK